MDPNNGPNSIIAKPKKNSQCIELRFLIPSKAAGSVIGKSGENIRNLRRLFMARINVSDNSGPERVLSLEADLDTILELLAQVLEKMEVGDTSDGIMPLPRSGSGDSNEFLNHVDLRMLVNQSLVGALIGRGGGRINELREKCELRLLKVYQTVCPESTDRIVQIIGTIPLVTDCINKIVDMCKETPVREPKINYDAQNFDTVTAVHYGGWSQAPVGRSDNISRVISSSPHLVDNLTQSLGFSRPGYTKNSNSYNKPDQYDYYSNNYPAQYDGQEEEMQTKEMRLPHKVVGAIIGPGGSRIQQVRLESGAHITISSPDRNPQERVVTVTGYNEQLKRACNMINEWTKISELSDQSNFQS